VIHEGHEEHEEEEKRKGFLFYPAFPFEFAVASKVYEKTDTKTRSFQVI